MQFRNFAEMLLGSRVKVRVLKVILSQQLLSSEREIAGLIGVSHTAVIRTVKDFQNLYLIAPLRVGNTITWRLNKESYAYKFLCNLSEMIQESPLEHLRKLIKTELSKIAGIKRAVIFGSVAEGREMPTSDIDLFILVQNDKEKERVIKSLSELESTVLRSYGNMLSITVFTKDNKENSKNRQFLKNVDKGIEVML